MSREEIAAKAVEYKHSAHNCAQAVARALSEAEGLNAESITTLTAGFGGGMGCMEATCGALIGAGMVMGLVTGGKGTTMHTSMTHKLFTEKCGASLCKDLKGRDTGVVLCDCDSCVRNAVYAYLESK